MDCRKATAFDKKDERMIFATIEATSFKAGGLNEAVSGHLRLWLEESSLRVLQNTAGPEKLKLQMTVAGFLNEQGKPHGGCIFLRSFFPYQSPPLGVLGIVGGFSAQNSAQTRHREGEGGEPAVRAAARRADCDARPDAPGHARHPAQLLYQPRSPGQANRHSPPSLPFPGPPLRLPSAAIVSAWDKTSRKISALAARPQAAWKRRWSSLSRLRSCHGRGVAPP